MLIGALNLLLGERADRTLIRGGSDSCLVEAVFDTRRLKAPLKSFLEENGLEACEEDQLVLKRALTSAGTNRQFINGSPTTLNTLAALGEWLVDIHGPHEHQSLLNPGRQLAILDAFGDLEAEREQFAALVRRRAELEAQKAALIVDERPTPSSSICCGFRARRSPPPGSSRRRKRKWRRGIGAPATLPNYCNSARLRLDLLGEMTLPC